MAELITELTINGRPVEKYSDPSFIGCQVYTYKHTTEGDDSEITLLFIRKNKLIGTLVSYADADMGQSIGYVSEHTVKLEENNA